MADSSNLPSALTISHLKSALPLTLDRETGNYQKWATLFKVQAKVHDDMHHIQPPTEPTVKASYEKTKAADLTLWKRIDAAVLQWIYATVSNDILNRILKDDDTAADAWLRVAGLFQDNKTTRALYLHKELINTKLVNFPDTNAYCDQLKSLADQLDNVGAGVTDNGLIIQLLDGLSSQYSSFTSIIRQKKKPLTFDDIRSKLALEELTKREKAKQEELDTALAASANSGHSQTGGGSNFRGNRNHNSGGYRINQQGGNRNGYRNRQNNDNYIDNYRNDGYGGYTYRSDSYGGNNYRPRSSGGRGRGQHRSGGHYEQSARAQFNQGPGWGYQQPPYIAPPCPYPSQPWSRLAAPQQPRPNFHGGRPPHQPPQQAYNADSFQMDPHMAYNADSFQMAGNEWTQTNLTEAMHTMNLSPPPPAWIMDTGATSHMTSSSDGSAPNAV